MYWSNSCGKHKVCTHNWKFHEHKPKLPDIVESLGLYDSPGANTNWKRRLWRPKLSSIKESVVRTGGRTWASVSKLLDGATARRAGTNHLLALPCQRSAFSLCDPRVWNTLPDQMTHNMPCLLKPCVFRHHYHKSTGLCNICSSSVVKCKAGDVYRWRDACCCLHSCPTIFMTQNSVLLSKTALLSASSAVRPCADHSLLTVQFHFLLMVCKSM